MACLELLEAASPTWYPVVSEHCKFSVEGYFASWFAEKGWDVGGRGAFRFGRRRASKADVYRLDIETAIVYIYVKQSETA